MQISKIQAWRAEQKKELERNLQMNKERFKTSTQATDAIKDEEEYEEHVNRLNNLLNLYNEGN